MPGASRKLAKYRAKRDFRKTAEPSGREKTAAGHSYLIQKHAARRLHYDFRLEMGGVLKSWAVTKGPSLNPADKRLAVHVEDHPLAYGKFEGIIPQGEYGGGTVMLWDQGSWQPEGDAERSYKKGHMTFDLHGKRLKGRWHLVRMGRAQEGKKENWLLIKGKDQHANDEGDYAVTHFQKSVTTKRSMEQIAGKTSKVWTSKPKQKRTKKSARRTKTKPDTLPAPPDFVAPQLATLISKPPEGKGWIHEVKFDGYRLLARISHGNVVLLTRTNNDWTSRFKSTAEALADLDATNALLDGEIIHQDSNGTTSFHALQNALGKRGDHLHYYAFDLLFLDGEDWRGKPLLERKTRLQQLLKRPPRNVHYSAHFKEPGTKVLEHACHIALEGIVSKRADAAYSSGRSRIWLKSKCINEQEMVIGGFTHQLKHPGTLGALLIGHYRNGDLIFAGKVGTGFSSEDAKNLLKKFEPLKRKAIPFKSVPMAERRHAIWLEPKLVGQISFTKWTEGGALRHPVFHGLREDKPARQVVREKEETPTANEKVKENRPGTKMPLRGKAEVAGIILSHPDKILFKDQGVTKLDLAKYYEAIASWFLAHAANRPISLMRCPEGTGGECFFQRHISQGLPKHVHTIPVAINEIRNYLTIKDVQGLIELVQMGVLEIHIWGAHVDKIEQPDRLVFDLDPSGEISWDRVKQAALDVRERLKALKLTSFLEVTGGKGLHIVVPIKPGPDWKTVKEFCRQLAQQMARDNKLYTVSPRKADRIGKIFVDYLRNGKGASAIAPYSTRARKGAPVAVPIDWKELPRMESAHTFTMQKTIERLTRQKKDPWKDMLKLRQNLPVIKGRR